MKAKATVLELGPENYHVRTRKGEWMVEGRKAVMLLVSSMGFRVVSFRSVFAYSENPF